jgi:hypothetical protein
VERGTPLNNSVKKKIVVIGYSAQMDGTIAEENGYRLIPCDVELFKGVPFPLPELPYKSFSGIAPATYPPSPLNLNRQ